MNRSTGWLFHCAPFHRLESSETGVPWRGESGSFRKVPSAGRPRIRAFPKLPHSPRPQLQLVPQPENPSAPLSRPFAPVTMLGLAALALRVWASANGRPLHSGPFRLRDKTSRPRVPRLFIPASPPYSRLFSSPFLRTPSPYRSLLACPTPSRI